MIVWVPADDKWRHLRDFIENLRVFLSCHLHQLPKGSESWVCKLIFLLTCCLGNWEGLARLSRTSSPCKERYHHHQGATMGMQTHLLMPEKAWESTLLSGSCVAWRAKRGKNLFWGYCCQLTWLWCTCVSRQHFHIYAVCFNMSNSWCFCKVSLAPFSLLFSTVSIK